MIIKQLPMAGILFFKMRPVLHRQVFIAINIPCKFGEDIFLNARDAKIYVKT